MIIICLSSYHGEKYIKEQLLSLQNQTYKDFKIIVRDDGSSDTTLDIVNSFNCTLLDDNKNLGPKNSFALLLEYSLKNREAEYVMFCDQDDVWKPDKIEKTLQKMQELEREFPDKPLLVHSDLELVDEELHPLSSSMWQHEQLNPHLNTLSRLLVQNTITGCTLMINKKLALLASPIPESAKMHDYWLGLVAGYFGKIGILEEQTILYRQHSANTIGSQGFSVEYFREKLFKEDILSQNILQAKAFLEIYRKNLDESTREMLEDFVNINSKSFWQKRKILFKHKLFKQGFIRNIGLLVKV